MHTYDLLTLPHILYIIYMEARNVWVWDSLDPKENSISALEEQPEWQKVLNSSEATGFGCRHSGGSDSPGHSASEQLGFVGGCHPVMETWMQDSSLFCELSLPFSSYTFLRIPDPWLRVLLEKERERGERRRERQSRGEGGEGRGSGEDRERGEG